MLLRFLKAGELELTIAAPGFLPHGPVARAIRENDRQELEILLQPLGDEKTFQLLLPGGLAAAGAEAELAGPESPLWAGLADEFGKLTVPTTLSGILLVRHPQGALWIGPKPKEGPITLMAAAPPVVVRLRTAEQRALPHARVQIWVTGSPWPEHWLRFFGMSFTADQDGIWRSGLLPTSPFSILAYSHTQLTAASSGQLDSYASEINFPWPEVIDIIAIE